VSGGTKIVREGVGRWKLSEIATVIDRSDSSTSEAFDHLVKASDVVGVVVCGDDEVELGDTEPIEQR
jgi:hypothetical protein